MQKILSSGSCSSSPSKCLSVLPEGSPQRCHDLRTSGEPQSSQEGCSSSREGNLGLNAAFCMVSQLQNISERLDRNVSAQGGHLQEHLMTTV